MSAPNPGSQGIKAKSKISANERRLLFARRYTASQKSGASQFWKLDKNRKIYKVFLTSFLYIPSRVVKKGGSSNLEGKK
uniref:Uncharacterized protein n=1 Tax=Candidatus Methanophagaceae archaeon ANME-1 ERB6 TaxID=2759912 RepID=A0A7G9YYE7_9EURY|nr:hypothetical protein GZ27E6_10 [uncultured archaeon GZfos27E6]QNO53031.1 hypothetical protein GKHFHOKN_00007 [Methanosarcinales archaeon ANME-1 ERB6]